LALIFAVLGVALLAQGQLVLNQVDTWTYEFSSLPFQGGTNAFQTTLHGEFGFSINSGSFQNGDTLAYEMFENNTSEVPICSQTMASAPPYSLVCSSPMAWQDVQGIVRFRMLSGSITVDNVTLRAITPSPSLSSYNLYESSFTPVPEPVPWHFFAAFLCAAIPWLSIRPGRIRH
jgi:hypothetical protein